MNAHALPWIVALGVAFMTVFPGVALASNAQAHPIRSGPPPATVLTALRGPTPATGGALFFSVQNLNLTATGTYDQKVDLDSASYSDLINANWSNGEAFYSANATPIYLWIESNATNTSVDTVLWLRMYSIPPLGQVGVALRFADKSAFVLSPTGYSGENPLLSSAYGAFDNGALVFNFYDNFAGTSLSSKWSESGTWTFAVNDGVTITGIAGNGGYISSSTTFAYPEAVDFYGNLYQPASASQSYDQGIGTSGCSGCGTASAVGFDAGGGNVLNGPTPAVFLGSVGWWDNPVVSTQTFGIFTAVAVNNGLAQFYLNYSQRASHAITLPSSPQAVGLAMAGFPSGPTTNDETTYWMRERGAADTAVTPILEEFGAQRLTLAALPGTLSINQSVTLVTSIGPVLFATFAYSGLPVGCPSANLPSISCVVHQTGQFAPMVTVTDGVGDTLTASTNLTVLPPSPTSGPLSAAITAAPNSLDLNASLTVLTTVSGGVTPYTYAYTGLPPGCAPADEPSLNCVPSTVGTFTLSVTVSDAVGESVTASTSLMVNLPTTPVVPTPPALVVTLTSFGSSLQTGSTLVLVASASGGAAPYSYSYTGLPAGCSSANASSLDCVPTSAGQFSVVVTVTDSSQHTATSTSALTLTAPPPAQTPTVAEGGLPSTTLDGLIAGVVIAVLLAVLAVVLALRRAGAAGPGKSP